MKHVKLQTMNNEIPNFQFKTRDISQNKNSLATGYVKPEQQKTEKQEKNQNKRNKGSVVINPPTIITCSVTGPSSLYLCVCVCECSAKSKISGGWS